VDQLLSEIAALLHGRSSAELLIARGVVLSVLYPRDKLEKSNADNERPARRWWFIGDGVMLTPIIIGQ